LLVLLLIIMFYGIELFFEKWKSRQQRRDARNRKQVGLYKKNEFKNCVFINELSKVI